MKFVDHQAVTIDLSGRIIRRKIDIPIGAPVPTATTIFEGLRDLAALSTLLEALAKECQTLAVGRGSEPPETRQ